MRVIESADVYKAVADQPMNLIGFEDWFMESFLPGMFKGGTRHLAETFSLEIRSAYLRIWHEVYVTVSTEENRKHILGARSRIWPRQVESAAVFDQLVAPTCIAEEWIWCLRRLTGVYTTYGQCSAANEIALQRYCFEAVLPSITGCFTTLEVVGGSSEVDTERQRSCTIEIENRLEALFDCIPDGVKLAYDDVIRGVHEVPTLQRFSGETVLLPEPVVKSEGAMRAERFQKGWVPFTKCFAGILGIKDLNRMIGSGLRNTAQMLCQNDIQKNDGTYKSKVVVAAMLRMMSDNPPELQQDDDTLCKCLRIARAMIYLDDPNDTEGMDVEANWSRFLGDETIGHRDHMSIYWAQDKHIGLEAAPAVVQHLSHHHQPVRHAALRYALSLVEAANKWAQTRMLAELSGGGSEEFFVNSMNILQSAIDNMHDERKLKLRQQAATQRRSVAGGAEIEPSGEDAAFRQHIENQWTEVGLLLRFFTACVQYHNRPFQHFLRDQHTNPHKYNLILKAEEVLDALCSEGLTEIPTQRSNGVVKTMGLLLDFLCKSMQGPCETNQVLLATSECVMILQTIVTCDATDPGKEDQELATEEDARAFLAAQDLQCKAIDGLMSLLDGTEAEEVWDKMLPNIQVGEIVMRILSARPFAMPSLLSPPLPDPSLTPVWKSHWLGCVVDRCWFSMFPTNGFVQMASFVQSRGARRLEQHLHQAPPCLALLYKPSISSHDVLVGMKVTDKIGDALTDAMPELRQEAVEVEFRKVLKLWAFLRAAEDVDRYNNIERLRVETCAECAKEEEEELPFERIWGGKLVKKKLRELYRRVNCVEINRNGRVYRVHFPVPEICLQVSDMGYFRDHFEDQMDKVQPRDNPIAKAASLLCRLQDLADEMTHYRLLLSNPLTAKIVTMRGTIEYMPFYTAVVKTLIILLTYGSHENSYDGYRFWYIFLCILDYFQVLACLLFCTSYFIVVAPIEAVEDREPSIASDNKVQSKAKDPPALPPGEPFRE